MTWQAALRVAAGIALGLGLGSLPFLRYGAHTHHQPASDAHAHAHAR